MAISPFVSFYIQHYTKPGQYVLDIGCGPGYYRQIANIQYYGCDLTNAMRSDGIPMRVDFLSLAEKLPIQENTFDLIFIKSAFYMFPNHGQVLEEIKRSLKVGGRIILFEYNKRTLRNLSSIEKKNVRAKPKCPLSSKA